jgi:tetratricopeptide (TPR) repeat protein
MGKHSCLRRTLSLLMMIAATKVAGGQTPVELHCDQLVTSIKDTMAIAKSCDLYSIKCATKVLEKLDDPDQLVRTCFMAGYPKPEGLPDIDAETLAILKRIHAIHGWPKISVFGAAAAQAAFDVTQHADSDVEWQRKVLPDIEAEAVSDVNLLTNWAYLVDRVAVNSGSDQTYGTQGGCHGPIWRPRRVSQPDKLDERRKQVFLEAQADYERVFVDRGLCKSGPGDIPQLTAWLRENPGDASAYESRAQIHLKAGELVQAALDFSKAIELDPMLEAAFRGRATVHKATGDATSAASDLGQAERAQKQRLAAKPKAAFIGAQLVPVTQERANKENLKEPKGAMILSLVKDAPGAAAGLQAGDIIVAINDREVRGTAIAYGYLASRTPGDVVSLQLRRNGGELLVAVTMVARPEASTERRGSLFERLELGQAGASGERLCLPTKTAP